MRVFEKANFPDNVYCPICGTQKQEPVVLVAIYGTQEDNICEAEQVHLSCLDLTIIKDQRIICQKY